MTQACPPIPAGSCRVAFGTAFCYLAHPPARPHTCPHTRLCAHPRTYARTTNPRPLRRCPAPSANGTVTGEIGQACFYFSNGCALGCDTCDGSSRGPIPTSKDPHWHRKFNLCNRSLDAFDTPICKNKAWRTVNTDVECGAADDWYYFSPWRAPGSAPVMDSCGVAGGHQPPDGGFGGIFVNTTHDKLGDFGSKVLPAMPPQATWKRGQDYEVTWTIEANHGGGYLYRLAPADGPLDEATFGKIPLPFVGQQGLRWGGGPKHGGSEIFFNGTYADEGTTPPGSKWVVNPIPRNDWTGQHGVQSGFEPHCDDLKKCQGMTDGSSAVPDLEIVDRVLIPADTPPGKYVLGWRWDCEESNQIWQSCSDIEVV